MKPMKFISLSACVLALAACSTIDDMVDSVSSSMPTMGAQQSMAEEFIIQGNCPQTEIVTELSGYSKFAGDQVTDENQLISRAHMTGIEATCTSNERSMTVDMTLTFRGMSGPAGSGQSAHNYPFFVAITSPSGKILAKEIFSASMDFSTSPLVENYQETLRQVIPLSDPEDGKRHKILVGFQLDKAQLDYNRGILEQQKLMEEAAQKAAAASANQPVSLQNTGAQ
ncbi:MAG: hypothetical protein KDJ35_07015 [Alphaproteobacteria bacterium]|nr:hypothetical protein [Alphaproteobacteria bacterium]